MKFRLNSKNVTLSLPKGLRRAIRMVRQAHHDSFRFSFLFLLTFALTSCEKEDVPVDPPAGLDAAITAIEIGPKYTTQHFFDLETNAVVTVAERESWDLAFETASDRNHVFLNTSKLVAVYPTGMNNWEAVSTADNATWQYDPSEGYRDSTAIGNWWESEEAKVQGNGNIYIIDRGRNTQGNPIGYKKLLIDYMENGVYHIKYANLDGSEEYTATITKDEDYDFIYFSFEGRGSVVTVAPSKDEWDLVFTQYTHLFKDIEGAAVTPYSVNGVLLNPEGVEALTVRDTTGLFEAISILDVSAYSLTTNRDEIGYDWKFFDLDDGFYTIPTNRFYLIRDRKGIYYKLRFLDFVNTNGENGYPKFELQPL